jgi:PKD repeat protein
MMKIKFKVAKGIIVSFLLLCSAMMISTGLVDEKISEIEESNNEALIDYEQEQTPDIKIKVVVGEPVFVEPEEPPLQSPEKVEEEIEDPIEDVKEEIKDKDIIEEVEEEEPEVERKRPRRTNYASSANRPPAANAGADRTVDRNEAVQLDGSNSYDPDGSIVSYTWYFQDDTTGTGVSPTHAYNKEGFYFVILVVEDNSGATDQDSVVITVHNEYPDAEAQVDINIGEDHPVTLDAGGSVDTPFDRPTLVYSWNFGDGFTGVGKNPTHAFAKSGLYTVTLTVRDNDWVVDKDEMAVSVENIPPYANAGLDQTANEDSVVTFHASGSTDSISDLSTLKYSWNFGDDSTGSGMAPTHIITKAGTYTATLTVTDDNGAVDIDNMIVTVNNVLPSADAGGDQNVNEDQMVFFSGVGSDTPSDEPLLSYHWDFGDGTEGFGKNPIHSFTDSGTYTVTLTVTDDDGEMGQDIMVVNVANIGPVVDAGADMEVNEDVTVQFMGYGFDTPSDEQSLTYSWDFGDTNTGSGQNPTHSYTQDGIYTVTLTVTDHGTFTASDSLQVTVKNIPPQATATYSSPCSIVLAGDVLTFNADAVDSPSDMSTLTYSWDFGDGSTASGTPATHAYSMEGIYEVTLTVTDDDGAVGTDVLVIIVEKHTMDMKILPLIKKILPGETAEYVITLENTGSVDDAYDLTLSTTINPVWIDLDRNHVPVEAKHKAQVFLKITPPENLPLDHDVILSFDVHAACVHTSSELSNAPLYDSVGDDMTIIATFESRMRWAQDEVESLITDFAGGNPTDATLLKAVEEISEALFFAVTSDSPEFDYVMGIEHVKSAIHNLVMVEKTVSVGPIIDLLIVAVNDMVEGTTNTAQIQATAVNIHVVDAWNIFTQAQTRIAAVDYENGMEQYKNAYMEAERAQGEWVPMDYTKALNQAVADINTLMAGPYSPDAINELQLAKVQLEDALTKSDYGLLQDSFVSVKSAMEHLENALGFGAPTSGITLALIGAVESAVKLLIIETESHVGREVNDIKQAWSKFQKGTDFLTSGLYIQALDKFDRAFTHALLAEDWIPIGDAGYDRFAVEDDTVNFDASNSRDRDGIVLFYEWDFGDGYTDSGVFTSHVYKDAGVYVVTLLITDNEGLKDLDTMTVTIGNIVPTAAIVMDYIPRPGSVYMDDIIIFDAVYTDTPSDLPNLVFQWDFGDSNTKFGAHTTHAYTTPGVYNVVLSVTDEDGTTGSATSTLNVINVIPKAYLTYSQTAFEDEVVYLSGHGLDSPSHIDTLTYNWDFGDGNTGSGRDVTHVYTNEGIYTVTLTVTDDWGDSGSDSITVSVINPPPIADAGWIQYSQEEGIVNFFGTGLDTPSDQSLLTYLWDFGDGSVGGGTSLSNMYSTAGTYIVTLTVTDDNGDFGRDRIPVVVENVKPTADAGVDQTVNADDIVYFSGTGSDTPTDVPSLTYSWDFGDGSAGSGANPAHVYTHSGVYLVILTVTDDDGAASCDEMTVTMENVVPTANAGSDRVVNEDKLVMFSGGGSDTPSDLPLLTYQWDFGDGSAIFAGFNHAHSYQQSGTYTVTLTVTDDDGASATDTMNVIVTNLAPSAFAGPDLKVTGRLRYLDFQGIGHDTPSDLSGLTFHWNFGDGTTGSGAFTDHLYTTSGTYTVTLTVTDSDGALSTDRLVITYSLDSDEDGLPDEWEILYGLDPNDPDGHNGGQGDPDYDGLTNLEEYGYGLHPRDADTDDDGWYNNFNDGTEIAYWLAQGKSTSQAAAYARNPDVDGDSMSDGWEVYYGLNPLSSSDKWEDPDNDGLKNYREYSLRNKGAKPNYKDLFVEVDYMPGHYPHTTGLDYIEDYYSARGIHLLFEIDEEIPHDDITTQAEWDTLHSTYQDFKGTHKHVIYVHKYKSNKGEYPLGVKRGSGMDQVVMSDQECDDSVVETNLAAAAAATAAAAVAFLIGGVIAAAAAWAATYALMSVTEWQMETVILMHELGHSIAIIDYDSNYKEDYCSDLFCVMALASFFSCDPNPKYCSHHWSLRDLSMVE